MPANDPFGYTNLPYVQKPGQLPPAVKNLPHVLRPGRTMPNLGNMLQTLPFTIQGTQAPQTQLPGPAGPQGAMSTSQPRYNQALLNRFLHARPGLMQLLSFLRNRGGLFPVGKPGFFPPRNSPPGL